MEQKPEMTPTQRDFLARVIPQSCLKSFYDNPSNQAAFEAWEKQRKKEEQSEANT